jgi:hypothetical protein
VPNDEQSPLTTKPLNPPLVSGSIPPIPLEAISTLQEASADMLKALIRKDADREKQSLVAVGTIRTCLEIHFLPHMDVWKQDQDGKKQIPKADPPVVQERRNALLVGNLGVPRTLSNIWMIQR